jgi:hypothetical protein
MAVGHQWSDQRFKFDERARPAVQQEQRRARTIAPRMNEVKFLTERFRGELGEGVEASFLRTPVEPRAPIVDEPLKIREADT